MTRAKRQLQVKFVALFGIILTTCSPSAPTELWEKYKSKMSEDILHRKRLETSDMTFDFTSEI